MKERTVGYLVKNKLIDVGDKIKYCGIEYMVMNITHSNHHINVVDSYNRIYAIAFYNKVRTMAKKIKKNSVYGKIGKAVDEHKGFTVTFSATVDFEYVDNISSTPEEALDKFLTEKPWLNVKKSTPVDLTSDIKFVSLIDNNN